MTRQATAVWNGSGKEGSGKLSTQSTTLNQTQYSYKSRFEEGVGTNPEELMAAAHAGCFAMKLSFVIGAGGFTPESIDVNCGITLSEGAITKSHIVVKAVVPGMLPEQFAEAAADAKTNCPVSIAFGKLEITMEATLS